MKILRFKLKLSRSNGVTLQTDGYHNIPVFSSKSAGIIINIYNSLILQFVLLITINALSTAVMKPPFSVRLPEGANSFL